MRERFVGYYSPTDDEYRRLWTEGLIVLDTNVLLGLYRLSNATREELLGVLEALRDRLWIPHHVGLEFQRNRVRVIIQARERAHSVLRKAKENLSVTQSRVAELELDKSGLDIDPEQLLSDLKDANERLVEALESMHNSLVDVSSVDPIRDRLDALLGGRIGEAPPDQDTLDRMTLDADERYERRIPPGFRDAEKDDDPNGSHFLFDGLRYSRRQGDLILWRQILAHAKNSQTKTVLFVTAEQKDDWWWTERGHTLGPLPELSNEIRRESEVTSFWMYSTTAFANHASKYTEVTVSEKSLVDIGAISTESFAEPSRRQNLEPSFRRQAFEREVNTRFRKDLSTTVERVIEEWLDRQGFVLDGSDDRRSFPDFLLQSQGGLPPHGVDVKFSMRSDYGINPRLIDDSMLKGYVETEEGRLSGMTLVFVLLPDQSEELFEPLDLVIGQAIDRLERLVARLSERLSRRPLNVMFGLVRGNEFEPVKWWGSPFDYARHRG